MGPFLCRPSQFSMQEKGWRCFFSRDDKKSIAASRRYTAATLKLMRKLIRMNEWEKK